MVLLEENLGSRSARDGARPVEGFDLVFREPAEQIAIAGGRSRYLPGGLDGLASPILPGESYRPFAILAVK
jgi:hypothetical protein